jgi:hypothetical protein
MGCKIKSKTTFVQNKTPISFLLTNFNVQGIATMKILSEVKVQVMALMKDSQVGYGYYFSRFTINVDKRSIFTVRWSKTMRTTKSTNITLRMDDLDV